MSWGICIVLSIVTLACVVMCNCFEIASLRNIQKDLLERLMRMEGAWPPKTDPNRGGDK